jgi:carboxyl-terminal processing protease
MSPSAVRPALLLAGILCLPTVALAGPGAASDTSASPPPVDEAQAPSAAEDAAPAKEDVSALLPLEDLRAFVEVVDRIRSSYVEDIDDATLFEHAIRGMLGALDPHSAYLAGQDYDELREATSGSFGGVGIEIGFDDGRLRVISPIDDTPAQRAGVRAGDVIVELDTRPVEGMSLAETIDAMRGEPGTPVSMTVTRSGEEEPIEFELVRDVIEVASVRHRELEPGFGYIRIAQFQERTGGDLENAVRSLAESADGPLKGIVLDLRNNPGGVLQASVQVADAFLSEGRIVYTEGRLSGAEVSYSAGPDDLAGGAPVVVLVNEGTASAAEIVAGALQDHRRAVILGTPSFGKGSVQTVMPLSDERAIKLTTALYYTPNGRSIQAQGIVPDITAEAGSVRTSERRRRRESDLRGHLENADGEAPAEDAPTSALASDDYQLAEALNLLKGLHLLSMRAPGG